jgi:hypothetical protein
MARAVKYVDLGSSWRYGRVNEDHLAHVIAKEQEEGWNYEGIEDHGWILTRKWVAEFTKEKPKVTN